MEEIKKIPQKTIAFILVMIFMIYVSQTVYAFPTISVDFSSGDYGYFIDSSGNVSIYTIYIKTLPAGYSSKLDYSGIKIPEVFSDTHVFAAWLMEQDGEEGVLVSNKTLQSYIDEEMELDDDVDFTAQYISQLSTSIDKSSTLTSITLTANTEMAYDDDFEDIDIDYSYIWYLDGEELDETSDTLKVAAGGTYTVEAVGTVTIAGTEISIPSIDIGSADVEYIDFSDAEVIVSADNESPKTGQEVILTAKISPEYDGAEYTYEWYCADAGTEISFSADMPLTVSNDWTLIGGTESITVEVTEEETLYFCVVLMNGGENILYKYSDAYSVSGAKTEDTNDENTENGNTNNEEYTEENESTDNEENIEENEDTNDIENTKKMSILMT